jgi:hypothetical protein
MMYLSIMTSSGGEETPWYKPNNSDDMYKQATNSIDWPSVPLLLDYDFEAVLLLPRTCN